MDDEEGQLALACVERGWRYSKLDGDAFFFDERSDYLARVDERIARLLPGHSDPAGSISAEARSLRTVLAELARHGADAVTP